MGRSLSLLRFVVFFFFLLVPTNTCAPVSICFNIYFRPFPFSRITDILRGHLYFCSIFAQRRSPHLRRNLLTLFVPTIIRSKNFQYERRMQIARIVHGYIIVYVIHFCAHTKKGRTHISSYLSFRNGKRKQFAIFLI